MSNESIEERTLRRATLSRDKGDDRININNLIGSVNLGILGFLLTNLDRNISPWTIGELAIAIPCLLTSSLAYSKLRYRHDNEYARWDRFGWFTHSIGYIATLDAVAVMLYHAHFKTISWIFIGTAIVLFAAYSFLDIAIRRERVQEKSIKLGFYIVLIILGYGVPVFRGSL